MKVHRIIEKTYAEGPGCRFCIWVQGCNHKCLGCFAKDLWDFNGGYETSPDEIISQINHVKDDICGITFLGGEPFEYAKELSVIAAYIRLAGKTVITFTGYLYENIKYVPDGHFLLNETDLLIDGRFDNSLVDYSRPLVGSLNQRFIYLTDRITDKDILNYKNRFEIRISQNGKIELNGMGNFNQVREYLIKREK